MTPPASAAARTVTPRRAPRRVSGPARPQRVSAAAVSAPGIALPRPLPLRQRRRRASGQSSLAQGVWGIFVGLPQNRLLDRLVRGRIWIGLVAFALIGIVAMQLVVLKLNTGIGRALEQQASLQRENAALSIENSTSSAGGSIEPEAARRGMTIAPSGAVHFLAVRAGDAYRAATSLSKSPSTQTSGLTSASSSTVSGESSSSAGGEASAGSLTASSNASSPATASPAEQSPPAANSAAEPSGASSTTPSSSQGSGTTASAPQQSTPASTVPGASQSGAGQTTAASSSSASNSPEEGASPATAAGGGTQANPQAGQ
jgi:hypothetical protein